MSGYLYLAIAIVAILLLLGMLIRVLIDRKSVV